MTRIPPSFPEVAGDSLLNTEWRERREERLIVTLPVRLSRNWGSGATEVAPAVLVDVSASGLQVLTDQRFSLFIPPLLGTRFVVEFFLGQLEIRQAEIEVVRSEKRDTHTVILGGQFLNLPEVTRVALRSAVLSGPVAMRY